MLYPDLKKSDRHRPTFGGSDQASRADDLNGDGFGADAFYESLDGERLLWLVVCSGCEPWGPSIARRLGRYWLGRSQGGDLVDEF